MRCKFGFHLRLTGSAVFGPAGQRGQQARGDLRIKRVQGDHLIGQEAVTAAVSLMEAQQSSARQMRRSRHAPCWDSSR